MLFNNLTNYVSQLTYMANEILEALNIDYDASTSAIVQYFYTLDWKTMVSSIGGWLT